ncbi:MAG: NAD(P)-dependent oxidoreductase [Alphaproteobacteria bacterium]
MTIPIANRRIALVGGAGFIGHNLALRLKALGADVHIIDSLQVNNLYAFGNSQNDMVNRELYIQITQERLDLLRQADIPVHLQDAREYHALSNMLSDIEPQVVVQLAAVSHANRSNKDPYSTFDHSLRTLENALDYSRGTVEHFVFFSSSMVYGNFHGNTVTEDTICDPLGIYGALKFAGEKMVIAYNQVFDLPYTIVRPSALYGERCVSRRVGQIFIENAIQGADVTVFGDGTDALDFTYIGDLVQGIEKVIENENSRNETFNLTYGGARSIAQMAEIIEAHFPDVRVKYEDRDVLMPERGTLSVDKARRLIGYDPQFPLDKGFVEYIEWYKNLFERKGNQLAAS